MPVQSDILKYFISHIMGAGCTKQQGTVVEQYEFSGMSQRPIASMTGECLRNQPHRHKLANHRSSSSVAPRQERRFGIASPIFSAARPPIIEENMGDTTLYVPETTGMREIPVKEKVPSPESGHRRHMSSGERHLLANTRASQMHLIGALSIRNLTTRHLLRSPSISKANPKPDTAIEETKITECKEEWKNTLDHFPDGAFVIDHRRKILYLNAMAANMFEYSVEDLIDTKIDILISKIDLFERIDVSKNDSSPPTVSNITEFCTKTKTGKIIYLDISFGRMETNVDDKYYGYLIFIKNITDIKLEQEKIAELLKKQIELERHNKKMFYAWVPEHIAGQVLEGKEIYDEMDTVVGFCDIVGSTERLELMSLRQGFEEKRKLYENFDRLCREIKIWRVEYRGDSCMVACLKGDNDQADKIIDFMLRAIKCANAMGIEMRAGIHYGKVAAGVLCRNDNPCLILSGKTVHFAARLESTGAPGQIQVSQEIIDMLEPKKYIIAPRGEISLKGIGHAKTYFVTQA